MSRAYIPQQTFLINGDVPQGTTLVSMGTFPLEKVEKGRKRGQAPFFTGPFFLLFSSLGNVPFNTFNIDKKNGV